MIVFVEWCWLFAQTYTLKFNLDTTYVIRTIHALHMSCSYRQLFFRHICSILVGTCAKLLRVSLVVM